MPLVNQGKKEHRNVVAPIIVDRPISAALPTSRACEAQFPRAACAGHQVAAQRVCGDRYGDVLDLVVSQPCRGSLALKHRGEEDRVHVALYKALPYTLQGKYTALPHVLERPLASDLRIVAKRVAM